MSDLTDGVKVECTIPILPVKRLAESIAFYTTTLGFSLDWGDARNDSICSVSRDGCSIMLVEHPEPFSPGWVWIGLEDELLMDEYRSRGVTVRQDPKNFSWAYEMKFEDIDDNVLWVGTESRKNEPIEDG